MVQAFHVHHHHHHHHGGRSGRGSPPAKPSRLDELTGAELIGLAVAFAIAAIVLAFFVARAYVEVRQYLVSALLTLASLSAGTAVGAFLALKRYDWFDRSWRWPVTATALVAIIGFADAHLSLHPSFLTGDYGMVVASVAKQGWDPAEAFVDVDANVFLLYQAIAAVLALIVIVSSLILVLGLWTAIEEGVGLRAGLLRRGARHLVQRGTDGRGWSIALVALALFSAATSAGWTYNGLKSLSAIDDDSGPTVSRLSAETGRKKFSLRLTVEEPVRVLVRVSHGSRVAFSAGRFELRSGSHRRLVYGRADHGLLRAGRYRIFVVIRDEAGNATRRERVLRVRAQP